MIIYMMISKFSDVCEDGSDERRKVNEKENII
jgi:hypothetical protein